MSEENKKNIVSSSERQLPVSGAVDKVSQPSVCMDCKGTIYKTKLLLFSAALSTPSIIFFL